MRFAKETGHPRWFGDFSDVDVRSPQFHDDDDDDVQCLEDVGCDVRLFLCKRLHHEDVLRCCFWLMLCWSPVVYTAVAEDVIPSSDPELMVRL